MDTEILTDELVQFSPKSGLLYAPSADSGAAPLLCREEYPRVTGFGEVNRTGTNKKKVDLTWDLRTPLKSRDYVLLRSC